MVGRPCGELRLKEADVSGNPLNDCHTRDNKLLRPERLIRNSFPRFQPSSICRPMTWLSAFAFR